MINNYAIYQCPVNTDYCFRGFDEAKETWSINDYVRVYSGTLETDSINNALEMLFIKFNMKRPSDYHGRSLSVSDVAWIGNGNKGEFYYCDSFGWSECPSEGR